MAFKLKEIQYQDLPFRLQDRTVDKEITFIGNGVRMRRLTSDDGVNSHPFYLLLNDGFSDEWGLFTIEVS